MRKLKETSAAVEVTDPESLEQAVRTLLSTPAEAKAMVGRAQEVVKKEQGATQRHVEVILGAMS